MTKRTVLFFVTLFAVFSVFADQSLNSVAAVVNNQIITQSAVDKAMVAAKAQLAAGANPNAIDQTHLRSMVLQNLIDEKLQLELAKQAHITVSDAQVNQAISRIAQQHNMTVSQLESAIVKEGMSVADYRKMIHKQILIHQVEQSAVGNKVGQPTAADLKKARAVIEAQMGAQKQYHVIDVLVPTQQQAQQIMGQLKNGASIKTVAPSNDVTDMGWQTSNTLPELFLQQLSSMKKGDIAGPIQAPNGYHVIQLVNVHGQAHSLTQAQLNNIAYQIRFQHAVKKWMKEMRKTAYVKIN